MGRKYKGISRVDNDRMHGWFTRVYYKGKVYGSKYFSDLKYDGKRHSLNAAVEFRNKKTEERNQQHPESKSPRRHISFDKRNKTGVIGVSRSRRKNRNGSYTEYFQATWYPKRSGKAVSRSFSINKYGEEEAFRLACEARKEAEEKIFKKENE